MAIQGELDRVGLRGDTEVPVSNLFFLKADPHSPSVSVGDGHAVIQGRSWEPMKTPFSD